MLDADNFPCVAVLYVAAIIISLIAGCTFYNSFYTARQFSGIVEVSKATNDPIGAALAFNPYFCSSSNAIVCASYRGAPK